MVFFFGCLIPRILSFVAGRKDERSAGAPTNRLGKVEAEANLKKHSDGGIDLNASISMGGEDADSEEDEADDGPAES